MLISCPTCEPDTEMIFDDKLIPMMFTRPVSYKIPSPGLDLTSFNDLKKKKSKLPCTY